MATAAGRLPRTLGESLIAAAAAGVAALVIEVPVWAMFIGWVTYFSRGVNLRQGAINLACAGAGLVLGLVASVAIPASMPLLGAAALPLVVFVVALVVLTVARTTALNNPLAWFLGLVCWFAAHQAPSAALLLELGAAVLLGCIAGWLAGRLHQPIASTPL